MWIPVEFQEAHTISTDLFMSHMCQKQQVKRTETGIQSPTSDGKDTPLLTPLVSSLTCGFIKVFLDSALYGGLNCMLLSHYM